jgi:hypothetical protein
MLSTWANVWPTQHPLVRQKKNLENTLPHWALDDLQRTRLSCGRMFRLLTPPPLPLEICLSFSDYLYVAGPAYWRETGPGAGVGRGAKSYYHEKAWPSVNHSILTALPPDWWWAAFLFCIVEIHITDSTRNPPLCMWMWPDLNNVYNYHKRS